MKFGKLTAIKESGVTRGARTRVLWLCQCECGNQHLVTSGNLKAGATKSCGCMRPKTYYSKDKFYMVWRGMINRCHNPNVRDYKNWGGRGIVVCDEWRYDFPVFRDWMIRNGARKGLSVDRFPDKNGNYCPENCRLATSKQQTNNTNYNRALELNGVTKNVNEWCADLALPKAAIFSRLRRGWSTEMTLTIPVKKYKKQIRRCH
jgi:hypothetical protein